MACIEGHIEIAAAPAAVFRFCHDVARRPDWDERVMCVDESWQFSPVSSMGGGTRFTLVWDYRPRGFLARIADVLGRRAEARRAIQRSLANLKAVIEVG